MVTLLFVLLSRAAELGPPATTYGARDPVPPTTLEGTVEELALGRDATRLAPTGSLRTYARSLLSLPADRELDLQTHWFLAEHAGLHALPGPTYSITFHGQGAAEMGASIRSAIAEHVKDAQVKEVAIAIGDLVGGDQRVIITFDDRSVRLAPFPRHYEPGAVARIRARTRPRASSPRST